MMLQARGDPAMHMVMQARGDSAALMVLNPRGHRRSDMAFAGLLGAAALALWVIALPGWLRSTGLGLLIAMSAGFAAAMCFKYGGAPHRWARVAARRRDFGLLLLPWGGLAVAVLGSMLALRWLAVLGTLLSASIGCVLLLDSGGVAGRLAAADRAVDMVMKPGWLPARQLSSHERRAWVRATGVAWMAGTAMDIALAMSWFTISS